MSDIKDDSTCPCCGIAQIDAALRGAKRYELWVHAGSTGSMKNGHAAEIDRLRAALETVKKERDETRKVAEFWRDEAVVAGGAWSLPLGGLLPWENDA